MKFIPLLLLAFVLTACSQEQVAERQNGYTPSRAARAAPGLVPRGSETRVEVAGRVISIGKVRVGRYDFAVVKNSWLIQHGYNFNSPYIRRDVLPAVQRVTGCQVADNNRTDRKIHPDSTHVFQLECF